MASWKETVAEREKALAEAPDTPVRELSRLAHLHPLEVLSNPALALIALEDPAAYRTIHLTARGARLERLLREGKRRVSAPARQLWACDCLERLSPLLDDVQYPRGGLEAAREYLRGRAPLAPLLRAVKEAWRLDAESLRIAPTSEMIRRACELLAITLSCCAEVGEVPRHPRSGALLPAPENRIALLRAEWTRATSSAPTEGRVVRLEEEEWQLDRLQHWAAVLPR
jgi:hypothetical protein